MPDKYNKNKGSFFAYFSGTSLVNLFSLQQLRTNTRTMFNIKAYKRGECGLVWLSRSCLWRVRELFACMLFCVTFIYMLHHFSAPIAAAVENCFAKLLLLAEFLFCTAISFPSPNFCYLFLMTEMMLHISFEKAYF